ncbi:MAG TPA: response regulator transcription factor [Thermomicrobiales bacterium]|nr:response regulator transcription factor [Thermomicrobiales bacterium]
MAIVRNTVMIVDDHPLFRHGLRRIIEEGGRFKVVAEAESGYEAIQVASIHQPHIILSDIQLPGVTGLKIARILKKQHPQAKIIMCSMHMDDERLMEAVRIGASAFVTKEIEAQDLVATIAAVAAGEQPINATLLSRPQLAWKVFSEFRNLAGAGEQVTTPAPTTSINLSTREVEVLDCVSQGLSNKEIADALFITEQTVKNHMTSVLRKLGVHDRVQAVLYAVKHGWVEIGTDNRVFAA